MKRILIDLTDLEAWGGQHGGIQRVVFGLAKNFSKRGKQDSFEVCFMSFSSARRRFYVSDFAPILRRVEGAEAMVDPGVVSEAVTTNNETKGRAGDIARPVVPNFVKFAKWLYGEYMNLDAPPLPLSEEETKQWVSFGRDDVVVMLGKPWDDLAIQETLTAQKKKVGFYLVQVVYDMIVCLQPHLQNPVLHEGFRTHMLGVVSSSDLLLAISESTARDVKEFCRIEKVPTPAVKVIRLGDDIADERTLRPIKPDLPIKKHFIACTGTVEIRKNHALLYYAYRLGIERKKNLPQLIIVGGEGWLSGDVQYLIKTDPAMRGQVIIDHSIDDAGLLWLYQHCMFTVYPSMYEGWGLPVAESLVRGKVCISSGASSMPEIAGGLVDYFSPYSPEELLQKIEIYMDDTKRRAREIEIKKNYKTTSWEETYAQVLGYIQESLND